VLPLLHGIPIVSARTNFEAQFPGAPLSWKAAAFAYTLHERFNISFDAPKLVVSIGDSDEEKIALRIAANQHAVVSTATMKLLPHPSPAALAVQLDMVCAQLPGVCRGSSCSSSSGSSGSTTETEIVFSSAAVAEAVQAAEDATAAAASAAVAVDDGAVVAADADAAGLSVTVLSSDECSSSESVSCCLKQAGGALSSIAVDTTEPAAPPTPPPTPPTLTVADQSSSSSSGSSSCAVQERSRNSSSMGESLSIAGGDTPLSSTNRMVAAVPHAAAPIA
jgi:hypothetical protein